jgi:hypothetical protein
MPIKYLGNKTLLYLRAQDGSTDLMGICNRNLEMERSRELIEITTTQGQEVRHVMGLKRGVLQFNGLSMFPLGSEQDTNFFDETVRLWFEAGTRLLCKWVTDLEDSTNKREIIFYGVLESWRAVRNVNEVANYDFVIRWDGLPDPITCPIVSVTNVLTGSIPEIDFSFSTSNLADKYTVSLYDTDDVLIQQFVYTTFGATITGTFDDNIQADTFYYIVVAIEGTFDNTCTEPDFLSFSVPCPILTLTVGVDSVAVSATPNALLDRVVLQLADSIDPVNIIDFDINDAPFSNPLHTFASLDEDTTYYVRAVIQILDDSIPVYTRTCGWVEFTTGVEVEYNVIVANQSFSAITIAAVEENGDPFITIDTGAFPLAGSTGLIQGNHIGFAGAIEVEITNYATACALSLDVNGTVIECKDVTSNGLYTFDSDTYLITDVITIVIQDGTCI